MEEKKSKPTRTTQWGRWVIIQEAEFPDHFIRKSGKKAMVATHLTKAVALELAQWDAPGSAVYKSAAYISHNTQIPIDCVNKALRVLRQHDLLRRSPRGLGQSKLSVLDWEAIEALRKPFRDRLADEVAQDKTDAEVPSGPPPAPEKISSAEPSTELVASIRELKHIGGKLTQKDAEWVAESLVEQLGEDGVDYVVDVIDERTLAKVSSPDIKKKSPYLLKCVIDAFKRDFIDQVMSLADEFRTGESVGITLHFTKASCVQLCRDELLRSLRGEFEIGDAEHREKGWFIPISSRTAVAA